MRRLFVAAVGFAALARSGPLEAEPAPALEIGWQGPEECAGGEALRAKVLRLLGGSARAAGQDTRVFVRVRRERGHYVAVLETSSMSGGGKKRLEGESCDAITLASAVVIALAIDPDASFTASTTEDPPEPPPAPSAPPPPPRAPPPRALPSAPRPSQPPPSRELRPYLHASVGVLLQLLNEPTASTGGGVGLRYRRLSLELGGAVHQTREVTRDDRPKLGAELRLVTGELLGCYTALPFRLGAVDVCPGLRLEYLSAEAFGASHPDEARVLIGSGLLVARGRLRATSWLSAELDLGLAARPFQPRFVLLGVGQVFETPASSAFARTGLVLDF